MIKLKTFQKVLKYFNGDLSKANQWLHTPHSGLNGIKPLDLAEMSQHEKLDQFIQEKLSND